MKKLFIILSMLLAVISVNAQQYAKQSQIKSLQAQINVLQTNYAETYFDSLFIGNSSLGPKFMSIFDAYQPNPNLQHSSWLWTTTSNTVLGWGAAYQYLGVTTSLKKMENTIVIGPVAANTDSISKVHNSAFSSAILMGYSAGPKRGAFMSTIITPEGFASANKASYCVSLGTRVGNKVNGSSKVTDSIAGSIYIGYQAGKTNIGLKSHQLWLGSNIAGRVDDSTKVLMFGYMDPNGTANKLSINATTTTQKLVLQADTSVNDPLYTIAVKSGHVYVKVALTGSSSDRWKQIDN